MSECWFVMNPSPWLLLLRSIRKVGARTIFVDHRLIEIEEVSMVSVTRRKFIELAASFGACLAWRSSFARDSRLAWRERRDLFPQGVASGDPHSDSVILWTRRPPSRGSEARKLTVEVSDDPAFRRVVATATASLSAETD